MSSIQEKLDRFTNEIMYDVTEEKRSIDESIQSKLEKEYSEAEHKALENGYEIVQKGLKDIDREKHEMESRILMDTRVRFLTSRNQIITDLFEELREMLVSFTHSNEYYEFLHERIIHNLIYLEDGDYIVYVDKNDAHFVSRLQKEVQQDLAVRSNHVYGSIIFEIEPKTVEMIGGCKVLNKSKNMFVDDSLMSRLEMEKEAFLKECKLMVE